MDGPAGIDVLGVVAGAFKPLRKSKPTSSYLALMDSHTQCTWTWFNELSYPVKWL